MSERVPNIFVKKDKVEDAATLFVNGKVYEGWEDIQITRELNVCASDFQIKMTDKWRQDQEPWRVQPGDSAHIHIAKKSVFTGFIEKIEASVSANARDVSVGGRSKTCDLVDSSLVMEGNQFNNLNLKEIAEKACKPFGISVSFLTDPGLVFSGFVVQQGETVFAMLDRLARQRKILIYPSTEGSLVFASTGQARSATPLIQGQNVLSGKSSYDFTNRFSKYIAKGQDIGFLAPGEKTISSFGEATDEGISRYRPLIVIQETSSDSGISEGRAAYEASLRKAQSLKVELEVQGWFQANGELWDINKLVRVDCGFLGVKRQMLIKKVTYNKNNSGTRTIMELVFPDSFNFAKKQKKEDPLGWTKGLNK